MTTPPAELPDDLAPAHALICALAGMVDAQTRSAKLQHQLEPFLRHRSGRTSATLDPDPLWLLARAVRAALGTEPVASQPVPPEQPATTAASPAGTTGQGRTALPAGVPRTEVLRDPAPERLPCPDRGAMRARIGAAVREQLADGLARLIVLRQVRPTYACQACAGPIVLAERLPEPIATGRPGPGLLAQVIVSNAADHVPLDRQERIFARPGVELSRRTTCDGMAVCAERLEPIWKALHRRILPSRVIPTADTPVQVRDPTRRPEP